MMIRYARTLPLLALFVTTSCQESPAERCQREAEEYNRTCPHRIDAQTWLDSMKFDKGSLAFVYYHTVTGEADSILKQRIEQPETKAQSVQSLLNEAGMLYYLEHGITFQYRYFLQGDGTYLGEITITPDDYR